MDFRNYIRGDNPFNLLPPPKWWLDKLWDFDADLVVVPSKMQCVYRLAQRRPPDRRANLVHHLANDDDSRQLARYGLVPVTTIKSDAKWDNPLMWEDLRQRSPHRMGGAEAFEKALLAKEEAVRLRELADRDDAQTQRIKDSWNYYHLKRGVRSNLYSPKTKTVAEKPTFKQAPAIKIVSKYAKSRD